MRVTLAPAPADAGIVFVRGGVDIPALSEFVVDTTGRVDASTIKIINTAHQGFNNSAKEAVSKTVFRPGKLRGQPVNVMVRQQVVFTP